jgi:hypothetical protein
LCPSIFSSYEGRDRSTFESAAEKISSRGIPSREESPLQDGQNCDPQTEAGHNIKTEFPVVVKNKVGAVIFYGNSEKLWTRSLQFKLPLRFFLCGVRSPIPPEKASREALRTPGHPMSDPEK